MNPLEELHKRIDDEPWDMKQEEHFNKAFQEVSEVLHKSGEQGLLRKSEAERQVFAFTKTPEKRLSFRFAGTKTIEDGTEIPFEWPDIKEWRDEDFDHIRFRFDNCRNLYARTEYGLLLYYSDHLSHNKDVTRLLEALIELSNSYLQKGLSVDDKDHYILHFHAVLANAFYIANNRKGDAGIWKLYEQLIRFATDVHSKWVITHKRTLRAIIDITDFAVEYKKDFEKLVSLGQYLNKNYMAAKELAITNNWGAIYICDVSQRLADAIDDKTYDWQTFKAEQLEAMIQPNIDSGNLAAISFVEDSLAIYKRQNNQPKIKQLSKRFDEVRRMFRLGEFRTELPEDETKRVIEIINKEVAEKNSRQILEIFCLRPMYSSLENIQKMAVEDYAETPLLRLTPSSIIDKYGNTVAIYATEEEKKEFQFWQTYGLDFQVGTQRLVHFFFEAFKIGKISFDSVIEFLSPSWIGKTYRELYNGYEHEIRPLDAIKPGLRSFFDELEKWKADNNYSADFVCATDSLVTKAEYLLRYFCKLAGYPTFTDKSKNGHKIKNEKNIDELLRSLKPSEQNPTGFLESHRKFIEFVLASKMGNNLRHRVAHGLMDAQEYTVTNPILMLNVVLTLSTYSFNRKADEPNTAPTEITK